MKWDHFFPYIHWQFNFWILMRIVQMQIYILRWTTLKFLIVYAMRLHQFLPFCLLVYLFVWLKLESLLCFTVPVAWWILNSSCKKHASLSLCVPCLHLRRILYTPAPPVILWKIKLIPMLVTVMDTLHVIWFMEIMRYRMLHRLKFT